MRKEILGKTKAVVVPIEPPATPEPTVEEVMPVSSHPIPESQPELVVEEVKLKKKRKKTKKSA